MGGFLGFVSSLRVAHWNANTSTNEHKALGELYGSMDDLIDDYAEISLGKSGQKVSASEFNSYPTGDNGALIQAGSDIVAGERSRLKQGNDDDLLNILADMDTALNKARYLLKTDSPAAPSGMDNLMTRVRGIAK